MAADHDLLFGLIALQNGLIDEDRLVAALRTWSVDRTLPLVDHLLARGDLDADACASVEILLDRTINLDVRHPLEGAERKPPMSSTNGDSASCDYEVDAGRNREGTWTEEAESKDFSGVRDQGVGGDRGDAHRYQVLKLHAQGGLGSVFLALDRELNREVALKQIGDRHARDPASRSRFLAEAEITGRLEHPSIAPVYSLGKDECGRLYYAMRFIEGESLKSAIERLHGRHEDSASAKEHPLELRKLLDRFLDVCHAIEFAHTRGVIHRDIKPSNIVLGEHGETFLVDWGLAKQIGSSKSTADQGGASKEPGRISGFPTWTHETLAGSKVGTPAYMSPEQADGRLEDIGPLSDVYALGATLYSIVTGQAPFHGPYIEAVIEQVKRGEFPRPRQVRADLHPALEALVTKAMALRPEDRYPSAAALAHDIENWLADAPVSAWREPLLSRVRRWWRRHPRLGTTLLSAVAVAVVALSIATVLLNNASRREAAARADAERHLAIAIKSVDELLSRFTDDPRLQAQGLETLRRDFLLRARELFFEAAGASDAAVSPRLRAERGRTYLRIARIGQVLGQFLEAREAAELAVRDLDTLHSAAPGDVRIAADLAQAFECLGTVSVRQQRFEDAGTAYQSARRLWQTIANELPSVPTYRVGYAQSLTILGKFLRSQGELEPAEECFELAMALCEGSDVTARTARIGALEGMGLIQVTRAMKEPRDSAAFRQGHQSAIRLFEDCLANYFELIEALPGDPNLKFRMSNAFAIYTTICCSAGQPEPALRMADRVRPLIASLALEHPDVPDYVGMLASVDAGEALCLAHLGNATMAVEAAERAVTEAPTFGPSLFVAAGAYCRAAEIPELDSTLMDAYLSRAVTILDQAREVGFFRAAAPASELRRSVGFRALQGRKDFEAFHDAVIRELNETRDSAIPGPPSNHE